MSTAPSTLFLLLVLPLFLAICRAVHSQYGLVLVHFKDLFVALPLSTDLRSAAISLAVINSHKILEKRFPPDLSHTMKFVGGVNFTVICSKNNRPALQRRNSRTLSLV